MKDLIKDESGISFGLFAAFLIIVMGGFIFLNLTPLINSFIVANNNYAALESQETMDAFSFGISVWQFMPWVTVFGVFAWIVVRAHERSG